jgi:sugar lactone lactonase YvrE
MRMRTILLAMLACTVIPVAAADDRHRPEPVSFTTLAVTRFAIEGLTGDDFGNLYTTGRAPVPDRCPVWQIAPGGGVLEIGSIGNAAPGCNPSGITRDRDGSFFIADANGGGVIWKVTAGDPNPASPFARGVPGTNGIAFDRRGNLWTGDGTTAQGRVWRITPGGVVSEMFRIQPMRNSTALGGTVPDDGVGRQARTFPPGTLANNLGGQDLVANGVLFDRAGNLIVADTARGALWKVEFDARGNVTSPMGCDAAFAPDTLCLENILVTHPLLEGTDGIILDRAGNIWNAANERNAIVVVTRDGRVIEIFRNPLNAARLRNSADSAAGNEHILELPTSPFISGHRFCVAQSDGNRRDNSPNTAGEINAAGPIGSRGKISCMDQPLAIPGEDGDRR